MTAGLLNKLGINKSGEQEKAKPEVKAVQQPEAAKKAPVAPKQQEEKKEEAKKEAPKAKTEPTAGSTKQTGMRKAHQDLEVRLDTEKSSVDESLGKYHFVVRKRANKRQIAEAVEAYYGVKVIKVNVFSRKPKRTRFGYQEGQHSGYKKAIVTLKEGDKLKR